MKKVIEIVNYKNHELSLIHDENKSFSIVMRHEEGVVGVSEINCSDVEKINLVKTMSAIMTIIELRWETRKTINYKYSAYKLKHTIERTVFYNQTAKNIKGIMLFHLSEMDLIIAMRLMGFDYNTSKTKTYYFNLKL
jgi:hypothetical protein